MYNLCAGYRACDSAPCKNGATCLEPSDGRNYWCKCAGPWHGAKCDGRRVILTIDLILYPCMRPFTWRTTAPSMYSFTVKLERKYSNQTECIRYFTVF